MASSELSSTMVAELEAASRFRTAKFLITRRPWLDLYGVRVGPVAAFGSTSNKPSYDPALIHRVIPDELLYEILARMTPYNLGRAACVCRKWRYTIRNPVFWRNACLKAWQLSGVVDTYKILHSKYEGSWRKMWLLRPRVRTDGLYVSRNTYIRVGIAEWKTTNPVHLVCYFRYIRFYPSGRILYKKVKEVAKFMNLKASKTECVYRGQYTLSDDKVEEALIYPGMRPTVLRIRLRKSPSSGHQSTMSTGTESQDQPTTTDGSTEVRNIEPIRMPSPEEIKGQDIWNNCAVRSVVSGVMGGGLGMVMGLFFGALDRPLMAEEMTGRQQFIYQAKQMGQRSWSSCKAFAVMGMVFSAAECVIEKARAKHDTGNTVFAGCVTGAAISAKGGPKAACAGCAGFAAFSVVIEKFLEGHE